MPGLIMGTLTALVTTLLCILAAMVYRKAAANKPIPGLPLAPDPHWLFGHIDLFMNYYEVSVRWVKEVGTAMCIYHPMAGPSLLTSSPEFAAQVIEDRRLVVQNKAMRVVFAPFFKNGMICLEGDMWKKHVRVLGPMLSVPRLKAAVPIMVEAAGQLETSWRSQLLLEPSKPRDVSRDLLSLSLAVIAEFVLGKAYSADASVVLKHCEVMMGAVKVFDGLQSKLSRTLFGEPAAEAQARSFMQSLVLEVMAQCRSSPEAMGGCAIGQIMQAVRDEGVDFSEAELLDEVVMIVFASHDTTATSLMWFLKLLAANPEVQDKLRSELSSALPRGQDPTYEDVHSRLPYLHLCVKELLRLAPTAPGLSRTLTTAVPVPGYPGAMVASDATVSLATAAMHRRPEYWLHPDRLWPERWEEGEGKGQAAEGLPINPSAYAPFGVGHRSCFGVKLATLELKVLLCQLVRSFRFLPTGDPTLDGMEGISRVTCRPVHPMVRLEAL